MRFASSSQRHDQSFILSKKTPKSSVYFLTPTYLHKYNNIPPKTKTATYDV
jgi:hypothetical protein